MKEVVMLYVITLPTWPRLHMQCSFYTTMKISRWPLLLYPMYDVNHNNWYIYKTKNMFRCGFNFLLLVYRNFLLLHEFKNNYINPEIIDNAFVLVNSLIVCAWIVKQISGHDNRVRTSKLWSCIFRCTWDKSASHLTLKTKNIYFWILYSKQYNIVLKYRLTNLYCL